MHIKFARVIFVSVPFASSLMFASNVLADFSTPSAGIGGGEGTGSSLPNAGSTEMTYLIFAVGAMLFVFGLLKLVLSYREAN